MEIKTKKINDRRHYYDAAKPDELYPGVTSVLDMLNKPFLKQWAANMTADLALDNLPALSEMDRKRAFNFIRYAAYRYTKRRADIGTAAHDDIFEPMIKGEPLGRLDPYMRAYRDRFAEFLDVVQPELVYAELTAWSDTHRYSGRFDAALRVLLGPADADGVRHWDPHGVPGLVMTDFKTTKRIYPEVALQTAAYAHADKIILPDGTEVAMPSFDGAFVLHVTPTGWEFQPIKIDMAKAFRYFLSLRHIFDWDAIDSKNAVGTPDAQGGEN